MLTIQDCIDICQLDEAEIKAIASHEHIPEMAAVELAEYLIHCDDGELRIKRIILDDIEDAKARGDEEATRRYEGVLRSFIQHHPDIANRA